MVYQGEAWSAVEASGPELPAETATKMPAAAALKNAASSRARVVVAAPPPME